MTDLAAAAAIAVGALTAVVGVFIGFGLAAGLIVTGLLLAAPGFWFLTTEV